jgi:hypothetical protein
VYLDLGEVELGEVLDDLTDGATTITAVVAPTLAAL